MKLANLWRKNKKTPYGFFGAYSTWEEASKYTAGYMSPSVNQFNLKTRKNLIAGLNNEFRLDDKSLQIIAGVCSILTDKQKTSLKVLDFGGSWGRYFYVLRHALPHVSIDWTVVEMNETVQAQKPFEESKLRWIDSMPTLSDIKHEKYDVFLASGALAYTPTPYQILEKATAISNYIIVTRHALTFTAEYPRYSKSFA